MIQFVCDNCSAVKQPDEVWIAGQAAEVVGAVSARREVTIQSHGTAQQRYTHSRFISARFSAKTTR
jgi:hypothetical protein